MGLDMKALLVLLAVFFAVQPSTGAAQVATKSFQLTAGTPVPVGEFEAVGSIPGCTATLISWQTVLTAAHCVCPGSGLTGCATRKPFTLNEVLPPSGSGACVTVSTDGDVIVHPEFGKAGWYRRTSRWSSSAGPPSRWPASPMQIAGPAGAVTAGQTRRSSDLAAPVPSAAPKGKQKMAVTVASAGPDGIRFESSKLRACRVTPAGQPLTPRASSLAASWIDGVSTTYRPIYENYEWVEAVRDRIGWQRFSAPASDFLIAYDSIDGKHRVYEVDRASGNINQRLNPSAAWQPIGGPGKTFVLANGGSLFGLAPDGGAVYRYDGTPGRWTKVGGPAKELYGTRAGLFATSPENGDLWRYTGTPMQWQKVGGPGKAFVSDGGTLYGLSPAGDGVFRYDGTPGGWTQVGGPAAAIFGDIAGLFAVSPQSGDLWAYKGQPNQWEKVGGPGKSFAVGSSVVGLSPDGSAVYALSPARTWTKLGDAAARVFAGGTLVCAMSPATYEVFCLDPMRVGW
jgi:hypothetical protein